MNLCSVRKAFSRSSASQYLYMFHITVWSINPGKPESGLCMLRVYLANHSNRTSAKIHLEQHVQFLCCSVPAVLV